MTLLSALPFVPAIAAVLIIGSVAFKHPREKLQSALAEGMLWGTASVFAFSAEILLLAHI